jgi:hypothetical protein
MSIVNIKEREPVHQVPDQEYQYGSFEYFRQNCPIAYLRIFLHRKAHGIAHSEKEGWKNKISGCKTIPVSMVKWPK